MIRDIAVAFCATFLGDWFEDDYKQLTFVCVEEVVKGLLVPDGVVRVEQVVVLIVQHCSTEKREREGHVG